MPVAPSFLMGTLATGGITKYPFTTKPHWKGSHAGLPVCHQRIALPLV